MKEFCRVKGGRSPATRTLNALLLADNSESPERRFIALALKAPALPCSDRQPLPECWQSLLRWQTLDLRLIGRSDGLPIGRRSGDGLGERLPRL